MKLSTILIISVMLASSSAVSYAETHEIQGSDTLHSAMALAIKQARLSDKLSYVGGGSGKGEQALIHGTQGIAPMSRRFSDAAISTAGDKGIHRKRSLNPVYSYSTTFHKLPRDKLMRRHIYEEQNRILEAACRTVGKIWSYDQGILQAA